MAFGRLERNPGARPMSDINMTPLIDVMLVLLVIFMITAPLMTSSLRLDLPRADGAAPSDAPAFVALAIDASGGPSLLGIDGLSLSGTLGVRVNRTGAAVREAFPEVRVVEGSGQLYWNGGMRRAFEVAAPGGFVGQAGEAMVTLKTGGWDALGTDAQRIRTEVIDGVPDRRACMTEVRQGMEVVTDGR